MPDRCFVPSETHAFIHFQSVDSTNAEALRRAQAGERGPLWITADEQTAGRGRSGRSWVTAPGALASTFLFAPDVPPMRLPELSLVAGVAVWDGLTAVAPAHAKLRLKWPNDVMIGASKVAGILVESTMIGGAAVAVIGIGANIGAAPALNRPTAVLVDAQSVPRSADVLSAITRSMNSALALWDRGAGFPAIRAAWLERSLQIGEAIAVNAGAGNVAGTFAGLAADGALLLDTGAGAPQSFTFGDVTLAQREEA